MARGLSASVITAIWAELGDKGLMSGLSRANGFPVSYSTSGGDKPTRQTINQLFYELYSFAVEINNKGLLSWDSEVSYLHPAVVLKNSKVFISLKNSTNQDPETENSIYWKESKTVVPDASTTIKGLVRLATDQEATAGSLTNVAITVAQVESRLQSLQQTLQNKINMATAAAVLKRKTFTDTTLDGSTGRLSNNKKTLTHNFNSKLILGFAELTAKSTISGVGYSSGDKLLVPLPGYLPFNILNNNNNSSELWQSGNAFKIITGNRESGVSAGILKNVNTNKFTWKFVLIKAG